MKYISTNIFSDFEFHDSYFRFESFKNNTLTITVKYLNVHKNIEQNPYDTDMEIEYAQIAFNNFRVMSFEPTRTWKQDIHGEYYTDEPQVIYEGEIAKEKTFAEFRFGITVMEFGTLENGNYYFDALGNVPWFQVQFLFDSATVEWDEFKKKAWYEEKPFKK